MREREKEIKKDRETEADRQTPTRTHIMPQCAFSTHMCLLKEKRFEKFTKEGPKKTDEAHQCQKTHGFERTTPQQAATRCMRERYYKTERKTTR